MIIVLSLPEPFLSFVRWFPEEFSTWSVLKREAKTRFVRPFVRNEIDAISFVDRDWDSLVVLDACRYDIFDEHNPFEREAKRVHSNASHTGDFLRRNFADSHPDTVYVTASPQVAQLGGEFAHVEHVWQDDWDESERTVLPEKMTDRALELADRFPKKRLVVHYMQPHFPFIGPTGENLHSQGSFLNGHRNRTYPSVWERLDAGEADIELVRDAYAENLEVALPAVERLVDTLDGKSVVTSDHGNLYGKRVSPLPVRLYGHPPGIPDPELTAVPWVELPFESRRDITASTTSAAETDSGRTQERLRTLGYV
ncbi:LTA synthase family protein [Halorhabdus sp. CUG00001]|uniref:LTA synthase family protein n=1 Tax=Halorhabdus sp. CUG00001 TaxID=2600297 RepID=UPI001E60C103|nr:LTA synthase family protein [Halorhabdus sp. CUG00001]